MHGCTSTLNGDTLGILRIYFDDISLAIRHSHKGFTQVLQPAEFVKDCCGALHGQDCRIKIWVLNNRKKIVISETFLIRYYKGVRFQRPHNEAIHGDELIFSFVRSFLRLTLPKHKCYGYRLIGVFWLSGNIQSRTV